MIRQVFLGAVVAGMLLTGGCASVVNGHTQSVSVSTRDRGDAVSGAQCTLTNDKGTWYVTSPGSVSVQRSFDALAVDCKLAGLPNGTATATSGTTAAVFGNILVGGIIGAGIDVATGAAYTYPNLIPVEMGRTTVVTPPRSNASGSGTPDPALTATPVPYLNDAQQEQYRTFTTRPLPRAFAISANGHYASMYTNAPFDKSLPADPRERALIVCSRLAGIGCELYAVDNQVVFHQQAPQAQAANVRSNPGRQPVDPVLAATRVPYLNDGQQAEFQIFLTQPLPRAFAISEKGHYATAWSNVPLDKSMPSDPRDRALAYCKNFSGQACRLYLVDNEIVYPAH